jgi:hypothetical protein
MDLFDMQIGKMNPIFSHIFIIFIKNKYWLMVNVGNTQKIAENNIKEKHS